MGEDRATDIGRARASKLSQELRLTDGPDAGTYTLQPWRERPFRVVAHSTVTSLVRR